MLEPEHARVQSLPPERGGDPGEHGVARSRWNAPMTAPSAAACAALTSPAGTPRSQSAD
jgi:hypothetical protein